MTFCTSGGSGGSLNRLKVRVTELGCCGGPLPSPLRSLPPSVCQPLLPLQRPLVPWEHSLTVFHFGAVWPGLFPRKPYMWRRLLFPQGSLHTSFGAPAPMGFSGPLSWVPGYLLGPFPTCPRPLLCTLPPPRACPPQHQATPLRLRGRALSFGRVELGARSLLGEQLKRGLARSSEAPWAM